ncbi:hypothetical protein NQ315_005816 [Exocentrus adspersus]|uniref:C2 domain-containing protein n=1 Tax=Exocentrus adspersus TaxID=1586481 RepID=A0AAV8VRE8_9CUCU|nr:hypothetical protein NQ315_005816 [Exocentrus adspersus]
MDNLYLKRELFRSWHRDTAENDRDLVRTIKSSASPPKDNSTAGTTFAQNVVKAPEDVHGNRLLYPYSVAAGAAFGLLLLIVLIVYLIARRNRSKGGDEEQNSSSILVYPSQQSGSAPQFLTKEIHFSLPPLRSTSLGDLAEDNPYDSDIDTDCLLLPTAGHSYRSNSFSKEELEEDLKRELKGKLEEEMEQEKKVKEEQNLQKLLGCYGLGVIEPALYKSTLDLDEIQWPEGHIGRLWFSLRYEPSTEKLLVSLLKAKNLPSRTVGTVNSCDPFVRLHLMPDERRYLQSKQKKKTCNPYFDETLVFQVSAKDMSDHTLKLTVIDGGRIKKKSEIGHVTYPLKDLEIGDGTEQQLFKMDLEKEPQEIKSDLGELLVTLVYNENLNRLTATVIEARRLKVR